MQMLLRKSIRGQIQVGGQIYYSHLLEGFEGDWFVVQPIDDGKRLKVFRNLGRAKPPLYLFTAEKLPEITLEIRI